MKPQEVIIKVITENDTKKSPEKVEDKAVEETKKEETPQEENKTESPKRFKDGSYRAWEWTQSDLTQEPLWNVGKDVLGLTDEQSTSFINEIGDITKLAIEYLQDDNPKEVYKLLAKVLRRTPQAGNQIVSLLRELQIMSEED